MDNNYTLRRALHDTLRFSSANLTHTDICCMCAMYLELTMRANLPLSEARAVLLSALTNSRGYPLSGAEGMVLMATMEARDAIDAD